MTDKNWPVLSYEEAKDTYFTLHMYTQVLGKIKLAKMPWINHSWHVTLMLTPTGFTTGLMPHEHGQFEIQLHLKERKAVVSCNSSSEVVFAIDNISVAEYYRRMMEALSEIKVEVEIDTLPVEMEKVPAFEQQTTPVGYDHKKMQELHKALLSIQNVFTDFRAAFTGKCSPVHFFWGGSDLAVTRFSGRTAPKHPGGVPRMPDWVAQEAYSHEVSSCGFWPGNPMFPEAAFYNYMYPEPKGFKTATGAPDGTYYLTEMGEYILPYSAVQSSKEPVKLLRSFLDWTYEQGATLAKWEKESFEPFKK